MTIQHYIEDLILGDSAHSSEKFPIFPTYRIKLKKGQILTQFDEIERKAYFLINGILESSIRKDGEFRIIDFVFPLNFACSYTSFLQQTPSDIQVKAITDCEVEYFLKEDLEEAYKTSLTANRFGRHVIENFFISKLKRENDFLTKSAKERYQNLLIDHPEFIQNIPVNKIAKYLGIHPESLSRIRAEIS